MPKGCIATVSRKKSVGIMGRGKESFRPGSLEPCSRLAVEGDTMCAQHAKQRDRQKAIVAARKTRGELR